MATPYSFKRLEDQYKYLDTLVTKLGDAHPAHLYQDSLHMTSPLDGKFVKIHLERLNNIKTIQITIEIFEPKLDKPNDVIHDQIIYRLDRKSYLRGKTREVLRSLYKSKPYSELNKLQDSKNLAGSTVY